VVNPNRFAAACPEGNNALRCDASLRMEAGFGLALAESCFAISVVDTFAETLNQPFPGQARKGLRDREERQVAKIL